MLPVLLAALLWAEGMMGTAYAMETVSLEIPAADAEEGELSEPEESAEEEADEPEEEKNEGFFSSVVNGVKSVFG